MLLIPAGVRVRFALGVTGLRTAVDGLAMLVHEVPVEGRLPWSGADQTGKTVALSSAQLSMLI